MTASKRKRLLALTDGVTTAQNLQQLAAANGIVTTVEYCRRVLKLAGRFKPAEPGRRIKHTAVYDLIKQDAFWFPLLNFTLLAVWLILLLDK